jgi:hypothetical protein
VGFTEKRWLRKSGGKVLLTVFNYEFLYLNTAVWNAGSFVFPACHPNLLFVGNARCPPY